MTVKFPPGRPLQLYYTLVLFIVGGALVYALRYFWFDGPLSSDEMAVVFEAGLQLQEMKEEKHLKKLEDLLQNDRVREAVALTGNIDQKVRVIQTAEPLPSFDQFESRLGEVRGVLNGLLGYPELKSIIFVLNGKMVEFESFARKNRWPALIRSVQRMRARISSSKTQTPRFFNFYRLSKIHKSLLRDVESIKKSTGSISGNSRKKGLAAQIDNLKIEMDMIGKHLVGLESFGSSYKKLASAYSIWINEVEPAVIFRKILFDKNNKNLFWGIAGLLALVFVFALLGHFVYLNNNSRIKKTMELMSLKVVKEGVLPFKNQLGEDLSVEFNRELAKYRDYFHKRMSFGSVFQEAVPFSCILLDSNLNMIWGNSLFYKDFDLEGKGANDSISWDFIRKFTNLGEDDPVLTALNRGMAGIYQVQIIGNSESKEGFPCEMYVSPVSYSGQNRIMIVFYSLRNLEETIKNQTKSITGPVSKALDSLIGGDFDRETAEDLKRDFEIAGVGELFDKFKKYDRIVDRRNRAHLEEIGNLESALLVQNGLMDDVTAVHKNSRDNNRKIVENFGQIKNAIVSDIELRHGMESKFKDMMSVVSSIFRREDDLFKASWKNAQVVNDSARVFQNIDAVRDKLKALRSKLDDFRHRLGQSVDQALVLAKKDSGGGYLGESLGRIKLEMKNVERGFLDFSEIVKSFDVGLSKIAMIIEQNRTPDFGGFKTAMDAMRREVEEIALQMGDASAMGLKSDEVIVNQLRSLYKRYKTMRRFEDEVSRLVNLDSPRDFNHRIGKAPS